jgi:Zn-dependent protease with chaperone function
LLLVGFYALALAVVVGLLYVPYAEVVYLHRIDRLTLFSVVGAGVILWSILPRIDRFTAPGPPLTREDQPRLFAALDDVARAAEQAMPREVYLVPDMNAWVAQRGGIMGVGSRRVMGVGLPLLQTLTVSQMRAVLAHEFGHYHGGDTALGPWIYKTRAAIGRTLHGLSQHTPLLMKPFEWYGKAFLRVTHAISRRQELAADALSARVSGTATTIGALKATHGAGMAFEPYWHAEVMPTIQRGFRPPLADGFRHFVAAPAIATGVAAALETEIAEGKVDPYDTHPPLRERIRALEAAPVRKEATAVDSSFAISLLDDVASLELVLINSIVRDEYRDKLAPLTWEDAGERVWVPVWREQARAYADRLVGITPNMLPSLAQDRAGLAVKLRLVRDRGAADDTVMHESAHALGTAMAVALHARGFTARAMPGYTVRMERGDVSIAPFTALGDLASGEMTAEEWRDRCDRAGITDLDLGNRE